MQEKDRARPNVNSDISRPVDPDFNNAGGGGRDDHHDWDVEKLLVCEGGWAPQDLSEASEPGCPAIMSHELHLYPANAVNSPCQVAEYVCLEVQIASFLIGSKNALVLIAGKDTTTPKKKHQPRIQKDSDSDSFYTLSAIPDASCGTRRPSRHSPCEAVRRCAWARRGWLIRTMDGHSVHGQAIITCRFISLHFRS